MLKQNKALTISGWVITVLIVALMCFSATFKLMPPPEMQKDFVEKGGFPANTLLPIGITEIACTLLFLIPRTSVLGAILLTGYLGGATCVHVRGGEPFFVPILVGVFVWLALFLRYPQVRSLIPIRCDCSPAAKA